MSEKQFYLLQVNDALFPIGGYSHSQGLETYIQRGIVHDADTAREYITHKIKWNLAHVFPEAKKWVSLPVRWKMLY